MTSSAGVLRPNRCKLQTPKKVCLDLFAGRGGFSRAFREHPEWVVFTVDIDSSHDPDLVADILELRPSDFSEVDVILASPPCTAFSMAASGTHIDADGRPISDWGATSIALTHHTLGLCEALDSDWYVIENPRGGMRNVLGKPAGTVWWCQYGADHAKPTDLWGRVPPSFEFRTCKNENPNCDHERAPRGSDTGTQASYRSASERAEIPHGLSEALLAAIERSSSRLRENRNQDETRQGVLTEVGALVSDGERSSVTEAGSR